VKDIIKKIKKLRLKEKLLYFTPKKYRDIIKREMRYAGLKEGFANRFIAFSFLFSLGLACVIMFDLWMFGLGNVGTMIGIVIGALSFVILQISIILIADSRASEVEKVLPDALQLMAANIRAGMTIDRAIWLSARPEFGILEEEIRRVGAKTIGGKPLKVALKEMTKGIKSEILDKTVKLIIEGIEAGGELAHLLEETANNIRVTQSLKKEIKSSVTTYSLFILFAAVLGAPVLFSISLFFVETMTKLWSPEVLGNVEVTGAGFGGGFFAKATGPQITPSQLFWFAISTLMVTTFFASLIIGLIQTGKEKNGIKFIAPLMLGAIAVFLLARYVVGYFFGSLFII